MRSRGYSRTGDDAVVDATRDSRAPTHGKRRDDVWAMAPMLVLCAVVHRCRLRIIVTTLALR